MNNRMETEALTNNLSQVIAFIEQQLETVDCSPKTQMQIGMATEEIFVNIAHYAYGSDTGKVTVSTEISAVPPCITITFTDSGIPYNPLVRQNPDITQSVEVREVGGLGIFLAKKLMDDIIYSYTDGHNILTMKL